MRSLFAIPLKFYNVAEMYLEIMITSLKTTSLGKNVITLSVNS